MQPIIFVDLDGVLVNLKQGLGNILQMDLEDYSRDDFEPLLKNYLKQLNTKELINFWSKLPKTKDCDKLWSFLKEHQPLILSASGNSEPSCMGKKLWCKKNLGIDSDRVFCSKTSSEKQKYASNKSILIDDFDKNIKQFNKNGGHGILHARINKTLTKLKRLLKSLNTIQKL
jgi:phosphoglycolate phosphatase-like HAD superfamily hydrolase